MLAEDSLAAKGGANFDGMLLHCVSVRYRVTGSGNLKTTLHSLDDVHESDLPNITMVSATNKMPLVLSNFRDQYIQYEFKTTEINEWFNISKVILFIKETATGYPQ